MPAIWSSHPAFVDIHTHCEAQVLWLRLLSISTWHVATVVMGTCGFGVAPTRPEHRGLVLPTLESEGSRSPDGSVGYRHSVLRAPLDGEHRLVGHAEQFFRVPGVVREGRYPDTRGD